MTQRARILDVSGEQSVLGADQLARLEAELEIATEGAPIEPPPSSLRDAVLGLTSMGTRFDGFVARVAELFDLSLDEARSLCRGIDEHASWGPGPGPGIRMRRVKGGARTDGSKCMLVALDPPHVFPEHAHEGEETQLYLAGIAADAEGHEWLPGDVERRRDGERHVITALGDEVCVTAVRFSGAIRFVP